MAAFPICYKTPYNDQNLPTQSMTRHNEKRFMFDCDNMLRSFSSIPSHICRSCHPSYKVNNILTKSNAKERNAPRYIVHGRDSLHKTVTEVIQGCYSKRENLSTVWCSSESRSIEKQLRSLDSYFGKLQDNAKLCTFDSINKVMQEHHRDGQSRSIIGLESLNEYLGKLNNGKV